MLSKYKDSFLPVVSIVARPFMSVHPNVISILGFLSSIVFALLLISGNYWLAIVSFVGIFFDTLDGYIARNTGKASDFGGFIDSTLDRISDLIIIGAFSFAEIVRWEISFALASASLMISYTRSRAELAGHGKFKLDVGIIERPERLLFIFILIVLQMIIGNPLEGKNILEIGFVVLIFLSLVSFCQRIAKAHMLLNRSKS